METEVRGDIFLTHLNSDAPFFVKKIFGLPTTSESKLIRIETGDLDDDYMSQAHPNKAIEPLYIDSNSPIVTVDYQDQLKKSYQLASGYEVTVMIAFVEKHPVIEEIKDPQRKRELYDRAISLAIRGFEG